MSLYQEALVVRPSCGSQRPVVHLAKSCAHCGVQVVLDNFGATRYTIQGIVCSEVCEQVLAPSPASQ